jgi:hypothetical protein
VEKNHGAEMIRSIEFIAFNAAPLIWVLARLAQ